MRIVKYKNDTRTTVYDVLCRFYKLFRQRPLWENPWIWSARINKEGQPRVLVYGEAQVIWDDLGGVRVSGIRQLKNAIVGGIMGSESDIMSREEIILAIESRDGKNCFLCKKPFSKDKNNELFEVTIDHWFPQSVAFLRGWTFEEVNHLSNLRKAHRPCNAAKGDLIPNEDGTLPERPKKDRSIKVPRPKSCDTCMNGRILLVGELCPDCNSGPQPAAFPKTLQKRPKECDHGKFHCWMCVIGHIPRKSAFQAIIIGE